MNTIYKVRIRNTIILFWNMWNHQNIFFVNKHLLQHEPEAPSGSGLVPRSGA